MPRTKKQVAASIIAVIIALAIALPSYASATDTWVLGITNLNGDTTPIDYNQLTAMPSIQSKLTFTVMGP